MRQLDSTKVHDNLDLIRLYEESEPIREQHIVDIMSDILRCCACAAERGDRFVYYYLTDRSQHFDEVLRRLKDRGLKWRLTPGSTSCLEFYGWAPWPPKELICEDTGVSEEKVK